MSQFNDVSLLSTSLISIFVGLFLLGVLIGAFIISFKANKNAQKTVEQNSLFAHHQETQLRDQLEQQDIIIKA